MYYIEKAKKEKIKQLNIVAIKALCEINSWKVEFYKENTIIISDNNTTYAFCLKDNIDENFIEEKDFSKFVSNLTCDEIIKSAFEQCKNLAFISIPDGVTKIEDSAFRFCTNLFSIFIPDSVTLIKPMAFASCTNLFSISIPNSITKIEKHAFFDCTNLKEVTFRGSKEEWEQIEIGKQNFKLKKANIIFEK